MMEHTSPYAVNSVNADEKLARRVLSPRDIDPVTKYPKDTFIGLRQDEVGISFLRFDYMGENAFRQSGVVNGDQEKIIINNWKKYEIKVVYLQREKKNPYEMMTTTTMQQVSDSRHSRLLNAREYAKKKGRKPLTPEQHIEFMKMVAEFTNL